MAATAKKTKKTTAKPKSAKPQSRALVKKGFKGKAKPAPKGNKFAVGRRNSSRNPIVTMEILAQMDQPVSTEDDRTKCEAMIATLFSNAIKGDMDAATFLTERVEGKVVQPVAGKVQYDVNHRLQAALETLPDEDLKAISRVGRKLAESEGITIIDVTPEELA